MDKLENVVLPMYYKDKKKWFEIIRRAANDVVPEFDSGRMVQEYYQNLYN